MATTSLFEYDCEAVRVRAKRVTKSGEEEHRKFSVDPNLTSYDILKSILTRAFDVSSEFVIYFSSSDEWLPLLSDWDLDAAILSAADPCLTLMICERKFKKLPLEEDTAVLEDPAALQVAMTGKTRVPAIAESSDDPPPILHSLRSQLEKTLPGLASRFQRALNLAEDTIVPKGQQFLSLLDASVADQRPLSETDFKLYLNKVGEVVKPRELRLVVYQRGIEPQLRKVLWKHLLGVYPSGLTGRQRVDFMKQKVVEYDDLKQTWLEMLLQGRVTDDLKYVTCMVKKDVLRTDRHLGFYSGEGNPNITMLYNILTTFALNHPSVGYCQGMSDLLSPLLYVMMDEGHAYVSFCALMSRLKSNFFPDGATMTKKFEHLSQGLLFYDPEFYAYLKLRHADDLLYCYRWLLLEMKREFSFEDACTGLEVLWASLPPSPQGSSGAILFEYRFGKKQIPPRVGGNYPSPPLSSFSKRETTFSNVVTLRKRMSSIEDSPKKIQQLENQQRGRIQSAGSVEDSGPQQLQQQGRGSRNGVMKKSQSLLSNSKVPNSVADSKREEGCPEGARKVTDLNDFFKMSNAGGDGAKESAADDSHNRESGGSEGSDLAEPIDHSSGSKSFNIPFNRLPPPALFGDGNPFLMFLCLSCVLQHRDYIMEQQLDYQEIAMYFDRMVRRHNVASTLRLARKMFAEYLNDDWKRDYSNQGDPLEAC